MSAGAQLCTGAGVLCSVTASGIGLAISCSAASSVRMLTLSARLPGVIPAAAKRTSTAQAAAVSAVLRPKRRMRRFFFMISLRRTPAMMFSCRPSGSASSSSARMSDRS